MKIKVNKMLLAMAEKQMKISDVSRLSGLSQSTIAAIKSGKCNYRPDTVGAVAKALNVPVGEIIEIEINKDYTEHSYSSASSCKASRSICNSSTSIE